MVTYKLISSIAGVSAVNVRRKIIQRTDILLQGRGTDHAEDSRGRQYKDYQLHHASSWVPSHHRERLVLEVSYIDYRTENEPLVLPLHK